MNIIALIPARGGSKEVPRKNIRKLVGKPLIQYTIDEAKKTNKINKIFVSTEDEEIAKISKDLGAEIIKRPEELASDTAPTLPVIQHAITEIEKNNEKIDAIVLLQTVTPFRTFKDIDKAIDLFIEKNPDSLVSVDSVPKHFNPFWQIEIESDNEIKLFMEKYDSNIKNFKTRRQDLSKTYYRNGAIYITKRDILIKDGIYGKNSIAFIMNKKKFINIDTMKDFEKAESIIKNGY